MTLAAFRYHCDQHDHLTLKEACTTVDTPLKVPTCSLHGAYSRSHSLSRGSHRESHRESQHKLTRHVMPAWLAGVATRASVRAPSTSPAASPVHHPTPCRRQSPTRLKLCLPSPRQTYSQCIVQVLSPHIRPLRSPRQPSPKWPRGRRHPRTTSRRSLTLQASALKMIGPWSSRRSRFVPMTEFRHHTA